MLTIYSLVYELSAIGHLFSIFLAVFYVTVIACIFSNLRLQMSFCSARLRAGKLCKHLCLPVKQELHFVGAYSGSTVPRKHCCWQTAPTVAPTYPVDCSCPDVGEGRMTMIILHLRETRLLNQEQLVVHDSKGHRAGFGRGCR